MTCSVIVEVLEAYKYEASDDPLLESTPKDNDNELECIYTLELKKI